MFSFCTLAEQFYIINQVFFFKFILYLKKKVVFLLKRVSFTNLSTFFRALSACVCVCVGGVYIEMYDMVTNAVNLKLFILNNFFLYFLRLTVCLQFTPIYFTGNIYCQANPVYIYFFPLE